MTTSTPSYIIENVSFSALDLGKMKFHYHSCETECTKETYDFVVKNKLSSNKYFEIRDSLGNDLLIPWSLYCHLESVTDQIMHCGNIIRIIKETEPNSIEQTGNTLFLDIVAYGASVNFYLEIRITPEKKPIFTIAYKDKDSLQVSVTFPLDKFIIFLEHNNNLATIYLTYSKGLFSLQKSRTKAYYRMTPKHRHKTSHLLFQCTCPSTKYEKFANTNRLVKYKD